MTPDSHVAVIGLGYVGLPLAIAFAEAGLEVQGIDVSLKRVTSLTARRSPIDDITDERLAAALDGRLSVATMAEARLDHADAVFELAGDINLAMPRHVVDLVAEARNDRSQAVTRGRAVADRQVLRLGAGRPARD